MKHPVMWILVANSSYAEIFELRENTLQLVEKRDYPDGRKKIHEIISDKPGRTLSNITTERHNLGEEEEHVRRHVHNLFIHELLHLLLHAESEHRFNKLTIVAPPEFLGEIRKVFKKHAPLNLCIEREIAKDLPDYLSMEQKVKLLESYCTT